MVLKFLGSFYILMSVECFLGPDLLVPNIPHFILLSAASGHFSRELSKLAVSTQSFHCTPFKPFGLGKPSWFFGSLKFFKPGNPISEGACWFGTLTHALEGAFFTRSPHSLYLGSPCVTPTVRCIVWRSATRWGQAAVREVLQLLRDNLTLWVPASSWKFGKRRKTHIISININNWYLRIVLLLRCFLYLPELLFFVYYVFLVYHNVYIIIVIVIIIL
jgi:hypothetical protein